MTRPEGLDLPAAVGRLVGSAPLRLEDVRREPLEYDAFLAGRSLVRVRGVAVTAAGGVPWSFVEKRTDGPETASEYLYDNGAREFEAYRSGLLDDLAPGLRAPALLGSERGADGQLVLWIEDVGPDPRAPLTPDAVLVAPRHLGRLAGRWLGRVPDHAWLFTGWIDRHVQPHLLADGLALVREARDDPAISARLGDRLDEAAELIAGQADYRTALEGLRPTLCHHDAVAANVFPRSLDGTGETILIDWESVGPGPVGADLASLLFASPRRGDLSVRIIRDLMPLAIGAYAEGLADVGASVAPDELRLGVHAAIALRWVLVQDVVRILSEGGVARRGSAPHESSDEALEQLVALVGVLLDSAAEARRLITSR